MGVKKLLTFVADSGPIAALALIAFAGSFSHIRATATDHGQTGWMATAVAVCIDLVCLVAARERQRDKKAGRKAGWPTAVLVGGVLLSLAANIEQAQPTLWGWITAGAPCAAFAVAVSLLERRGAHKAAEEAQEAYEAPASKQAPEARQQPAERAKRLEPATSSKAGAPRPPRPQAKADEILPRAREVAEAYREQEGKPITRDKLKAELGIGTGRATTLLRELKAVGM